MNPRLKEHFKAHPYSLEMIRGIQDSTFDKLVKFFENLEPDEFFLMLYEANADSEELLKSDDITKNVSAEILSLGLAVLANAINAKAEE